MASTSRLEKQKGLAHKLTVTVPVEAFNQVFDKHLKKAAKVAKVPGFRPGKVPEKVVAQKYGPGIRQDVVNELIQSSLYEAVQEHKLQIAGQPMIDSIDVDNDKPLIYTASFEVYPDIQLADMSKISVDRLAAEIKDNDVQEMINNLRKQNAEWVEASRASKNGDKVEIDFEGFIDDKPFQGNKAEKFPLELGSAQMIPGFEDGIVGMKAGDAKDITVEFPKDYPSEEVKGKKAIFKIHAHKVLEPKLPEVDAAFAKKLGFQSVDSMNDEVFASMQKETDRVLQQRLKMAVMDKLIEQNKIDIPEALIELEIKNLQNMTRRQMAQQYGQKNVEKLDLPRDPYVDQAKKRVTLGLLIGEVIKEHEIKVTEEAVRKKVEEIAQHYQEPEKVISWYYGNKQMLAEIESVLLEEMAVDTLLRSMQVKDKTVSYSDALKQPEKE